MFLDITRAHKAKDKFLQANESMITLTKQLAGHNRLRNLSKLVENK